MINKQTNKNHLHPLMTGTLERSPGTKPTPQTLQVAAGPLCPLFCQKPWVGGRLGSLGSETQGGAEHWEQGDGRVSGALRVLGEPGSLRLMRLSSHFPHCNSTKAMPLAWLHHNPRSRSGFAERSQDQPKGEPSSATPRKSCLAKRTHLGLENQRWEEGVESLHLPSWNVQ